MNLEAPLMFLQTLLSLGATAQQQVQADQANAINAGLAGDATRRATDFYNWLSVNRPQRPAPLYPELLAALQPTAEQFDRGERTVLGAHAPQMSALAPLLARVSSAVTRPDTQPRRALPPLPGALDDPNVASGLTAPIAGLSTTQPVRAAFQREWLPDSVRRDYDAFRWWQGPNSLWNKMTRQWTDDSWNNMMYEKYADYVPR
jgi:hypothetical protein